MSKADAPGEVATAHVGEVPLPRGYLFAGLHAGVKVQRRDLALIQSDAPAAAAAVTTQNQVHASCVDRTRRLLPAAEVRGVVINSGNANCLAGADERLSRARRVASL